MTTDTMHAGTQRHLASIRGNLTADQRDLIPVLARAAADDEPVTIQRLAATAGLEDDSVRAALAMFAQLEYDDHGRIANLYTRSVYWSVAFTSGGTTLYGCASDVLTFPVILGRDGIAEAACPATGTPIRIELSPTRVHRVDPPHAVVTKIRPAGGVTDVASQICGLGLAYSSPESAAEWLAHNPQGYVDTVTDDFEIHRRAAIELGWAAPDTPPAGITGCHLG